jgi:hypothetical protein
MKNLNPKSKILKNLNQKSKILKNLNQKSKILKNLNPKNLKESKLREWKTIGKRFASVYSV